MNNQNDSTTSDKKKPGRKPTSTSPALRKAQNRAAQRAFRERKEKHIIELEAASKQLREQRDKLMAENKELRSNVGVLGYESWHLKGAMLSLQLMCFINNIAIPDHSPYLDQKQHSFENDSIHPGVISAYTSACKRNTPPLLSSSSKKSHSHDRKSDDKDLPQHYLSTGSILVYKDSIQTVVGNRITTRIRATPPPQPPALPKPSSESNISLSCSSSSSVTSETPGSKQHSTTTTTTTSPSLTVSGQHRVSNYRASLHNNDATSPDCTSATGEDEKMEKQHNAMIAMDEDKEEEEAVFSARPIMLTREPIPSFNQASLQTLQLRHQLQAACSKMESGTFIIKPTVLQTTVPHDPRIDLIPITAMRDRMILFFELFDLDDCITCILKGIEYNGDGDPSHASSWRLPSQFYEDYWYLAQDYSIDHIRQRWPELEKMQADGSMHAILSKAAKLNQLADVSALGSDDPLLTEPTATAMKSLFPDHGRPPQGYPFESFLSSQQPTSPADCDFLPPLESIHIHQQQIFSHRMPSADEEDDHRQQPITLRPPDYMVLDRH
ncbi:hypothetical protein K492DRAFT_232862 [Lichtheimia hyalospora FSU 10163]|nr:hypothetical protein K492DRAFT_232862 [Lichtheimia hyalospora FSU 10163]